MAVTDAALRPVVTVARVALSGANAVPLLPMLGRVSALIATLRRGPAEGAARRRWRFVAGLSGLLFLGLGGLGAVAVMRSAIHRQVSGPDPVIGRAVAAPPDHGPSGPLRDAQIVSEQLNLQTRISEGVLFLYAGGPAGLQAAKAVSQAYRQKQTASGPGELRVVSLPTLLAAVSKAFRSYGFEVTDQSIEPDGPAIALSVHVPKVLRPLHDALMARITAVLAASPGLSPVQLRETPLLEGDAYLLATMVGKPASHAFTADGNKALGETVLNGFVLRAVRADQVELARPTGADTHGQVLLVIPLKGDSRLQSGALDSVQAADFTASIEN